MGFPRQRISACCSSFTFANDGSQPRNSAQLEEQRIADQGSGDTKNCSTGQRDEKAFGQQCFGGYVAVAGTLVRGYLVVIQRIRIRIFGR